MKNFDTMKKSVVEKALEQLAYDMARPTDCEGARFKIGDRVKMKQSGATGTVISVTPALPDVRFNYEVKRDTPFELEPGELCYSAFPVEDGLEAL